MKDDDVVETLPQRRASLERSRRRYPIVDVRIALIDAEDEIVGARELDGKFEALQAGDRPLRIGGRAEIRDRRAVEHRHVDGAQVTESIGAGRGQEHRLRPAEQGRGEINLIERVGDQNGRHVPVSVFRHDNLRDQKQRLSGAGYREHVLFRIEQPPGESIAPREPVDNGATEVRRTLHRGVAAPVVGS